MTFSVIDSLDDDSTLNFCDAVVVGEELVTGEIQHVAVAFATAALHIGTAENTPVGNVIDGMSPKKISAIYFCEVETFTLTVLMTSFTPLRR